MSIDKPHVGFRKEWLFQLIGNGHDGLQALDAAQLTAPELHIHIWHIPLQDLIHPTHITSAWNYCMPSRMEDQALRKHACSKVALPDT